MKDTMWVLDINNRFIIQYGYINGKYAGNTITYPTSFSSIGQPVGCLHFSHDKIGSADYQIHVYNTIKTSFQIGNVSSSERIFAPWIACGY